MKIGIITHHDVHNHGAQLQLFSLSKIIKSYGHEVVILDHNKNYDFLDQEAEIKYKITLKSIPYYAKYYFKNGLKKTLFNIRKRKKLNKFREENFSHPKFYSKINDLDGVIIGSDEVFSIEGGLNTFFWGMGVPCKRIYSYAGSFGPTSIEQIENRYAIEFIDGGIKRIKKASVRDGNSASIFKSIANITPTIVCDPVILDGYNYVQNSNKNLLKRKYMLIYSYDNNMNDQKEINEIIKFAKTNKLIIVSTGFYHKWCDKNINVSPMELIEYIRHAEYVITDTFHGTVISLITNVQFATKIRGNRNKIGYLLDEYNLCSREIIDFGSLNRLFSKIIDYSYVNEMIESKRELSIKFLESCLEDIKMQL